MVAPCKDCTERHVGCHSTCQGYKDFVKWNEEQKEIRKQEKPSTITQGSFLGNAISGKKHRRK